MNQAIIYLLHLPQPQTIQSAVGKFCDLELECSFRIGLLFSRAFICAVAVRSPRSAYLGGQVVGSSSQAQMLQKPKHR